MAQITAQLVIQLRNRTRAGMMECKIALLATNGDIEKAEVYLRKQGKASDGQEDGTRVGRAQPDTPRNGGMLARSEESIWKQ